MLSYELTRSTNKISVAYITESNTWHRLIVGTKRVAAWSFFLQNVFMSVVKTPSAKLR